LYYHSRHAFTVASVTSQTKVAKAHQTSQSLPGQKQ